MWFTCLRFRTRTSFVQILLFGTFIFVFSNQSFHLQSNHCAGNFDVTRGVVKARQELKRLGLSFMHDDLGSTLAAMIIFSFEFRAAVGRKLKLLRCSLLLNKQNIGSTTPMHVYLWVRSSSYDAYYSWLISNNIHFVILMPIEENSWTLPTNVGDPDFFVFREIHSLDYYLMGRWRLFYSFPFVRDMGYNYLLQIDDDTLVLDPLNFDIVQSYSENHFVMGVRRQIHAETKAASIGLSELARFWMVTRGVVTPNGTIFKHHNPPNIGGLSTEDWDSLIYIGAFMVFSIDFWFSAAVQDFLQLVHQTGADVYQRWQDQGVQNMIRLLFIRENELFIFNDTVIFHGRPQEERLLDMLGCPRDPRDGDPIAAGKKQLLRAPSAAVDGIDFESHDTVSSRKTVAAAVNTTNKTADCAIANSNSNSSFDSESVTYPGSFKPYLNDAISQESLVDNDTGRVVVEAPLNYEAEDAWDENANGNDDDESVKSQVSSGGDDNPLISFAVQIASPAGDGPDLDQLAVFQYQPCALGVPDDYTDDVFMINGKKCWAPLSGLELYSKSFCKSFGIIDTFCDLLFQKALNEAMKMEITFATVESFFQSTGGVSTVYKEDDT